jgi:hypothetical protein
MVNLTHFGASLMLVFLVGVAVGIGSATHTFATLEGLPDWFTPSFARWAFLALGAATLVLTIPWCMFVKDSRKGIVAHQLNNATQREQRDELGNILSEIFKAQAFALLVFPFELKAGDGGVTYLTNSEHVNMMVAMKEFIAKYEGRSTGDVGHG